MTRQAYSFVRTFAPTPERELCVEQHYLLCASAGALRLEAQDRVWLLPPARAALIQAGRPIRVSIPRPVTTASVLFDVEFTAAAPAPLTVFDLNPLARALIDEVGLAPRSLARRFETETGMTWRAVLRRMRVMRAVEELAAGDTAVTQIAFLVGYSSMSALNSAFRDLTGSTPTGYRAGFRT